MRDGASTPSATRPLEVPAADRLRPPTSAAVVHEVAGQTPKHLLSRPVHTHDVDLPVVGASRAHAPGPVGRPIRVPVPGGVPREVAMLPRAQLDDEDLRIADPDVL